MKHAVAENAVSAVPLFGDLPGTKAGDVYRSIALALTKLHDEGASVAVTSASKGEGKTTTAANVALAFASLQQPVLLIDMAFQRSSLEGVFGLVPPTQDLESVYLGRQTLAQVICKREGSSLHLALRNPRSRTSASADETRRIVAEARGLYKWVIVDCSSIADESGNATVAACDRTLLVVQERTTRRDRLAAVFAELNPERTSIMLSQH